MATMAQFPEGSISDEVTYLQRLYRITEGDRKAYSQDTKITLLKQRKVIHKLESEQKDLSSKLENGFPMEAGNKDEQIISKMLEEYQNEKKRLQIERQLVQNQKSEILAFEKEIHKIQITASKQSQDSSQLDVIHSKRLKNLEDKLENASVHLNKLRHRNDQLRDEIEHLIKQRSTYNKIHGQLDSRAANAKHQIESLTEDATKFYKKKDEAYQKLQAMKASHAKDQRNCEAQIQEAQRMVKHQAKMTSFYLAKTKKMMSVSDEDQEKRMGGGPSAQMDSAVLMAATGVAGRMTSFDLFVYCSDLNNKMEEVQKEIAYLQEQLKESTTKEDEDQKKNKEIMVELEMELSEATEEVAIAQFKLLEVQKALGQLRSGIDSMLQLIGGDVTLRPLPSDFTLASGSIGGEQEEEVSRPLMLRAIKEIEQQVNELILTRHFIDDSQVNLLASSKLQSVQTRPTEARPSLMIRGPTFQPVRESEDLKVFTLSIPSLSLDVDFLNTMNGDHQHHPRPISGRQLMGEEYTTRSPNAVDVPSSHASSSSVVFFQAASSTRSAFST